MPTRYLYLVLITALATQILHAQDEPERLLVIPDEYASIHHRGEQELLKNNYKEALGHFKKVLKKYPNFAPALRSSGACYELLGNLDAAAGSYGKALEANPNFSRALYFECGKVEYQLGHYEKALWYFEQFESLRKISTSNFTYNGLEELKIEQNYATQLEANLRACKHALDAAKFGAVSKVVNLGGGVNSNADEYFPYLTNDGNTLFYTSRKTVNADENLFIAKRPEGEWRNGQKLEDFNGEENEGMVTMVRHGRKAFFTACNRPGIKGQCDIWEADFDGQAFTQIQATLGAANSDFWESQASVSCDGTVLFFASNRDGGEGGTDIWRSQKTADGSWGEPVNLGKNVNTSGDEEAPFISNDGQVLFFSSTGHLGFGEQDIFVSRLEYGKIWGAATNLGQPVNSAARELGFFLTADGKMGYFASNRTNGFGGMDIYQFELPAALSSNPITYVEGTLRDSITQLPVQGVVYIKGKPPIKTESDGRFFLCVKAEDTLQTEVLAEDYHKYFNNFSIPKWDNRTFFHLNLLLDPLFKLPAFSEDLLVEKGVALPVKRPSNEIHHEVLFEFDKHELKPSDLQKLEAFFKQEFNGKKILGVDVVGYADDMGTDAYNLVLSEKRAKTIAALLKGKGIPVEKIYIEGRGENTNGRPNWQNRKVDVIVKLTE